MPVCGSNTRFFWIFARNTRLVARNEWLRRLPTDLDLPVMTHILGIELGESTGFGSRRQMTLDELLAFAAHNRIMSPALVHSSMSSFLNPPFIIAILIALSVHEWAHAFVAYRLGDPTAKYEGRLTLNPLAHLDLLGTLLFVTVGFGWGKPVPINPRHLRNVRRDTALISLAGPLSNLVLAIIAFFLLTLLTRQGLGTGSGVMLFLTQLLSNSLFLNLGLMAFNLLPIAPLDGSKIFGSFVPHQYEDSYDRLMQYGPYILLGLLLLERVLGVPLLQAWIFAIVNPILGALSAIV